jgi:tetratricopeptide (TPR) repeat protein
MLKDELEDMCLLLEQPGDDWSFEKVTALETLSKYAGYPEPADFFFSDRCMTVLQNRLNAIKKPAKKMPLDPKDTKLSHDCVVVMIFANLPLGDPRRQIQMSERPGLLKRLVEILSWEEAEDSLAICAGQALATLSSQSPESSAKMRTLFVPALALKKMMRYSEPAVRRRCAKLPALQANKLQLPVCKMVNLLHHLIFREDDVGERDPGLLLYLFPEVEPAVPRVFESITDPEVKPNVTFLDVAVCVQLFLEVCTCDPWRGGNPYLKTRLISQILSLPAADGTPWLLWLDQVYAGTAGYTSMSKDDLENLRINIARDYDQLHRLVTETLIRIRTQIKNPGPDLPQVMERLHRAKEQLEKNKEAIGPLPPLPAPTVVQKPAEKTEAELQKETGNDLFKKDKFEEAERAYSTALEYTGYKPQEATTRVAKEAPPHIRQLRVQLLLNRAACYLKLEGKTQKAVEDCSAVLYLDSLNLKALFRRASARFQTKDLANSLSDITAALRIDGKNESFISLMRKIEKEIAIMKKEEKVRAAEKLEKEKQEKILEAKEEKNEQADVAKVEEKSLTAAAPEPVTKADSKSTADTKQPAQKKPAQAQGLTSENKICSLCDEEEEALGSCVQCDQALCELHLKAHQKARGTKNHTITLANTAIPM